MIKVKDYFTKKIRQANEGELYADLMFMIKQSYIIEHHQDHAGIKIIREKYDFND